MPISIDNNYSNSDHSRIGYNTGSAESVRDTSSAYTSGRQAALTAGSTITGEIVEKDGDQVTIRLGNDQTISAKLQGGANIEVGMKLTFEVAKGANDQTALRPLFSNLTNNSAAMSAIKAAGLPVNSVTLAMTDKMMSESMPVNRNALAEMFRNVSTHQNASPESIVQMTKLNMPLTESNVIQFENYRNFEHQITNDLQNVSDGVADLFKEAVANAGQIGDGSQMFGNMTANEVINEVLNLIDTDSLETIAPESTAVITEETTAVIAKEAEAVAPEAAASAAEALDSEAVAEESTPVINAENIPAAAENAANVIKNTVDGFISNIKDIFTSDNTADPSVAVNTNLSLTPQEQITLSSDLQNILILAGESADIHEPLDPSQIMTAVKELVNEYPPGNLTVEQAELAAYSEETAEAADEEMLQSEAREDIASLAGREGDIANANDSSGSAEKTVSADPQAAAANVRARISEKLNDLLKSDGFSKLLKDSVKAQMSIKPQDVSQPGKIEELYDKIQKTSQKVTELMNSIGRADSAVAASAGALSDNVDFMNQLNQFVNYVQLPLKMAGEDANGELYVYTNKKNLSNRDGNYSALLHLDMEHLGPMDVYVTMRDHTKVSTNFYLESEELLDFIGAHIDELTARLTDKGYNTSTHVTKREKGQPIKPITDEFTKDEASLGAPVHVSKMRFDVRA